MKESHEKQARSLAGKVFTPLPSQAASIIACSAANRFTNRWRLSASHCLCHPLSGTKPVAYFLKGVAETGGRLETPKSLHRIIALLNATMVLL